MTGVNHLSGLTIFGDCAGQLDMLPLVGATVVCFQLSHENARGHLNAHPHQSLQKMTCPYMKASRSRRCVGFIPVHLIRGTSLLGE